MSNSNTNLQTQSSNALHNAIMEAGSKDRPPMLAPGQCPVLTQLQPNCKATQKEVIEIHERKTSHTATVLPETEENNCTSSAPTYDPEPATVTEDEEMSKEKEIDKLMALISLSAINVAGARENVGTPVVQKSGIQCYNCKEYGHVSRECQKPKRIKDAAYHKEKIIEAIKCTVAQLQEVTPDSVDTSGPIFDDEPMHKLVEIVLFIVDSGCSKHMTGNLKLLTNFVEKFLGTVLVAQICIPFLFKTQLLPIKFALMAKSNIVFKLGYKASSTSIEHSSTYPESTQVPPTVTEHLKNIHQAKLKQKTAAFDDDD
ncbi:integrase, catalytic region, zinc finger, CCHC-type containing protein [Tanacetum coccineum]